ncbi:hypothetical protein [Wohlfahrtiimonas larvae]|uniref:Uncharacterized protein n=1 Tax=Wohlfahrtiimonas larvae TaxID=1157986 RepID=A0ABP9MSV9_9GAMM|nr:hypothetical protein [Wohlfahrtiimonas larvae]
MQNPFKYLKNFLVLCPIVLYIIGQQGFAELVITKSPDDFGFLDILFGYLIGMSFLMWLAVIYTVIRRYPFYSIPIIAIIVSLFIQYGSFNPDIPNGIQFGEQGLKDHLPYWVQMLALQWLPHLLSIAMIFSVFIVGAMTIIFGILFTFYAFNKKEIDTEIKEEENALKNRGKKNKKGKHQKSKKPPQINKPDNRFITYMKKVKRMQDEPNNAFELLYSGSITAFFLALFFTFFYSIFLAFTGHWSWQHTLIIFTAIFLYYLLDTGTNLKTNKFFKVCFQALPSSATLFIGLFLFNVSNLSNLTISGTFLVIQMIGLYTGLLKNPININLSVSSSGGSSRNNSNNRSGSGGKSGGGGASSDW